MKVLICFLLVISTSAFATNTSCQNYSIYCTCFPNVPFEGFKLHIVEKCDSKEDWSTTYDAPTFDTEEQCTSAIKTDATCQELR